MLNYPQLEAKSLSSNQAESLVNRSRLRTALVYHFVLGKSKSYSTAERRKKSKHIDLKLKLKSAQDGLSCEQSIVSSHMRE